MKARGKAFGAQKPEARRGEDCAEGAEEVRPVRGYPGATLQGGKGAQGCEDTCTSGIMAPTSKSTEDDLGQGRKQHGRAVLRMMVRDHRVREAVRTERGSPSWGHL